MRAKKRNSLIEFGKKNGVEFGIHYPTPVNRQNAYKSHKQFNSKFKLSDKYSKLLISSFHIPQNEKNRNEACGRSY